MARFCRHAGSSLLAHGVLVYGTMARQCLLLFAVMISGGLCCGYHLVRADELNVLPLKNMKIETTPFGKTKDDLTVHRFTLTNRQGHSVSLTDFGATLLEVNVPDRDGKLANVNLIYPALEPYMERHPYFGSTVGRFCNRIAQGKFEIDGKAYQVTLNAGKHHLHGGKVGFDQRLWTAATYQTDTAVGVRFTLRSADGEEGYPGNVTAVADYQFNDQNELTMKFSATTDQPTHVNLTNHSYWNLAGAGSGTARDHVLTIQADQSLDVDADLIPTGKLNDLTGSDLDFRQPTAIGARIATFAATKGYDHCYVVRGKAGTLRPAAKVVDPKSGRVMEVLTTQPGMQLYTGNHLAGDERTNGHGSHDAFCLETQHYPNAPNIASFPSTLLRPGETMTETTVHRFSVE